MPTPVGPVSTMWRRRASSDSATGRTWPGMSASPTTLPSDGKASDARSGRHPDGAMPAGCPSDFNNDTVVDDADFSYFAQGYDVLLCP